MRNATSKLHRMRQSRVRTSPVFLLVASLLTAALPTSVVAAQAPTSVRTDTGTTTIVSGTVYDSIAHEPLSGAQVQFVDPANPAKVFSASADTLGRFRIDAIPSGKYVAGFIHPSIDVLGMEPPLRSVAVNDTGPNIINLWIPASPQAMTTLCGERPAGDSTGAMVGVIRDADSGLPIGGASVVVEWLSVIVRDGKLASNPRRLPVKADNDGAYRVCGLPGADTLLASAAMHETESGVISVAIPASGILRQDFALGDSASVNPVVTDSTASAEIQRMTTVLRGTARLSGVVLGVNRKPLADAQVEVRGTGLAAKTGADGRFALATLPAGTFSVEVRAIGLEPRVIPVRLSSVKPTSIEISLTKPVQELSRVLVFGKVPKVRQDLVDFANRKKSGLGHYFTQDDPALSRAVEVTNVLSMVPGVRITGGTRFGHVILMHNGCAANVYLDGVKMNVAFEDIDDIPANQIAGMEVYMDALDAPVQFPPPSQGCGTVIIWMKH